MESREKGKENEHILFSEPNYEKLNVKSRSLTRMTDRQIERKGERKRERKGRETKKRKRQKKERKRKKEKKRKRKKERERKIKKVENVSITTRIKKKAAFLSDNLSY